MVGVALAADVVLYRDGLAEILEREDDIDVIGVASTTADLVIQIQDLDPHVVLLDVGLPDGLAGARVIRTRKPATSVLAFAVSEVETDLVAWARAGIRAFVSRHASIEDLIATINGATRGESICPPRLTARLLDDLAAPEMQDGDGAFTDANLTRREREIVRLLELGKSNKEIAHLLSIAVPTVKNHVHNILYKLQVERRSQAARALEHSVRVANFPT